ncbi:MAG: DNA mismatch repair protein MutS [Candidatus Eremiobacteraeota bacterium]|nr:DNA mismatch repair protein MutS [Candidatus Eremiobacteraeota bacterium]
MRPPHEDKPGRKPAQTAPVDAAADAVGTSPLIAQYLALKSEYPEALLLSRVGDFYEAYGDDANELASALNIVCTSKEAGKGKRVAMAGVPHHSVDHYLGRLLRQRRIVAIAEQMEEPVPNRLVRREIVRVLTPGTVLEDQFLTAERNNYLCAVATAAGKTAIAAADISTSSAAVSIVDDDDALASELDRLAPAEIVVQSDEDVERYRPLVSETCRIAVCDPQLQESAREPIVVQRIALSERAAASEALGLLQRYLEYLRLDGAAVCESASLHETRKTMVLDRSTRRHLDLLSGSGESKQASVLNVLAKTKTPMGSRMLAHWLCAPLLEVDAIARRHDSVDNFVTAASFRLELQRTLAGVGDIERIVQKIRARRAGPRDLAGLRRSLDGAAALAAALRAHAGEQFRAFADAVSGDGSAASAANLLAATIVDEPAATLLEGGVIRPDHSAELQELIGLRSAGREHLLALEAEVRSLTGIKALKIRYTQAFGYYYEVSRAQAQTMPVAFVRRQSLVNVERFTDARLKELETRILSSRSQQVALERRLFDDIIDQLDAFAAGLLGCARALAEIDVYCSLAQVAAERRYVRPAMVEESTLEVEGGRHAVVEAYGGLDFVPNECAVDAEQRFLLITGPNMGGKSTYLRQTALMSILAQMGSFVPARRATLGIVDRLFTRIGAGYDIAAGRSTFYVEMAEMALILRNCTARSLLLIDEVGRGTGTIDGLAIAQAISEYLLNLGDAMPIVLFATHFHELVDLAKTFASVDNLHVAVADELTGPVFSHRLLRGSSSRSYGIAVANMAGMPKRIVERAKEIASQLEARPSVETRRSRPAKTAAAEQRQLEMEIP